MCSIRIVQVGSAHPNVIPDMEIPDGIVGFIIVLFSILVKVFINSSVVSSGVVSRVKVGNTSCWKAQAGPLEFEE